MAGHGKAASGPARAIAEEIRSWLSRNAAATVPELRRGRRAFSRRLREAPPRTVMEAALAVAGGPLRGSRFFACELIRNHPLAPALMGRRALERFGAGMDSWDAVDCFCVYLSGPAWRTNTVPTRVIHGWARSPDRWWRRAALVSTVPLNSRAHGGSGDSRRTLAVCRILERDRDPMVYKAMSWALRELSKRDPAAVRGYLADRAGSLAASVLREVRNKLDTGVKNPGRRR